jgi:DeoR family suf operon transcriptional repressor
LDQLKTTMPAPMVSKLFSQMATEMAKDYTKQLSGLNLEERLELIKKLLVEEGFDFEWERNGDQYHLHEISCPYYHIGQNHPEVCTVDQTLFSKILAVPAEKINCILTGDTRCTYVIDAGEMNK